MEQVFTEHMVDDVEPQDLAMEAFRKQFRLVAGCEVSEDGLRMTYQLKTMGGSAVWLSNAQSIITANKLPLTAKVNAKMKGMEVEKVELIITYKI